MARPAPELLTPAGAPAPAVGLDAGGAGAAGAAADAVGGAAGEGATGATAIAGMPRVHAPRLEQLTEGSLLAFAAAAPISIAMAQILLALFLGSWLVLRLRGVPVLRRRPGLAELAVVALIAGGVLACLVERAPGQLYAVLDRHAILLALPALLAVAGERPIFYRRAVIISITVAALVALYGIWQHFMGLDLLRARLLDARGDVFIVEGAFSHHLSYGGSVMLAIMAALALAVSRRSLRPLPAMLVLPLALALLWSYARSAWLGTVGGFIALGLVGRLGTSRRRLTLLAVALTVAALAVVLDGSVRQHIAGTLALADEPPPRVRIWQSTLAMLRDHPLGVGPGRFEALLGPYLVPGEYDSTVHAHSDMLRALTDGGPLALAGYLVLVAGGAVAAFRRLRRRRAAAVTGHHDAARRDLLAIALAASAAFFLAGLLQTYFFDLETSIYWVLLAAPAFAAGGDRRLAAGA